MKMTEVPLAVLRFQYQLARKPLQVIEEQVVARMGAETPARLLYERSMGRLDLVVGNALGARDLEQRGAALIERSEALGRAATLQTAANRAVKQAGADLKDASDAAVQAQQEAQEDKKEEALRARSDAAHQKAAAIQQAQDRVSGAKKQADEAAAKRTDAVETAKRQQQDKIRAAEKTVTAAANAKVEDAQEKRGDAAAKLAQANRVEQLADAEKEKRKDGSDDA